MVNNELEVVRSSPPTGAWENTFIERRWKQSKEIICLTVA